MAEPKGMGRGGGWYRTLCNRPRDGQSRAPALPPFGLFFFVLSPLQLGFSVEKVHVVRQEGGAEGPCLTPPGPGGGPPWVPDPLDVRNGGEGEKARYGWGREKKGAET